MRVRLILNDDLPIPPSLRWNPDSVRACTVVDGADHVLATGTCPNPRCLDAALGGRLGTFPVSGATMHEVDDRELHAQAGCRVCGKVIGVLVVDELTLFGFHEDRAVLHGRPRVY